MNSHTPSEDITPDSSPAPERKNFYLWVMIALLTTTTLLVALIRYGVSHTPTFCRQLPDPMQFRIYDAHRDGASVPCADIARKVGSLYTLPGHSFALNLTINGEIWLIDPKTGDFETHSSQGKNLPVRVRATKPGTYEVWAVSFDDPLPPAGSLTFRDNNENVTFTPYTYIPPH